MVVDVGSHLAVDVRAGLQNEPATQGHQDCFEHAEAGNQSDGRKNLIRIVGGERTIHNPRQHHGNRQRHDGSGDGVDDAENQARIRTLDVGVKPGECGYRSGPLCV